MAMTLDEIKAKAKHMYEHVDDINTMAEAKQAVRDACSMLFYTVDHIKELSTEVDELQAKGTK